MVSFNYFLEVLWQDNGIIDIFEYMSRCPRVMSTNILQILDIQKKFLANPCVMKDSFYNITQIHVFKV